MTDKSINDSFSNSDQEQYEQNQSTPYDISVLRHLPNALKILEGQQYQQQFPKCLYEIPLSRVPNIVNPKPEKYVGSQVNPNRLFKIQDTMFEHVRMKQKIQSLFDQGKQNKQYLGSLWNIYSTLKPSYARFGLQMRKNNFANNLMPLNGVNILLNQAGFNKKFQQQKNYLGVQDSIRFDSHFESGNLLYAYRRESIDNIQTYDLILQNDINTKGHNQWFYFKIYNMKKHNKIRLNIVNFIKNQSMFSYGIKPLTFSERDFNKHRIGWVRSGQKISYEQNNMKREYKDKSYYTLSFEYYFQEADTVYFAPTFPYTFSQLSQYFDTIIQNPSFNKIVSIKPVVQTIGKNAVSIVTISAGEKQLSDSKIVWILARQHPGETTSSYIIQGIINHLLSLFSNYSKTEEKLGIHNYTFKIVPMLNVDGVIHGNTRGELTGIDPNRIWKKPLRRLCPGISSIKKQIMRNRENVSMILDLHSHSKKTGCFFYGNTLMHNPKVSQIYPNYVCKKDQRFSLQNCRYRGGYETTARKVLFEELQIPNIFTVECSLLGYLDPKTFRINEYKLSDYYEMGKELIDSFLSLQKVKLGKEVKQIIQEIGIQDRVEIESARSQSSLSDEQYDEICTRIKNKFKKPVKVGKVKKSNEDNSIKNLYHFKKGAQKQKKDQKHRTTKNCLKETTLNYVGHKNSKSLLHNNIKNQIIDSENNKSPKQKTQNRNKKITTYLHNYKINATLDAQKTRQNNNKSTNKIYKVPPFKNIKAREIFVPQLKDAELQVNLESSSNNNSRYKLKNKNQQVLYVVGSSLEDEHLQISKNEVGIQLYEQLLTKEQKNLDKTPGIGKKQSKMKKTPKFLNYLCSNLIGVPKQNAIFPQQKKLGAINKKKLSSNALGIKN